MSVEAFHSDVLVEERRVTPQADVDESSTQIRGFTVYPSFFKNRFTKFLQKITAPTSQLSKANTGISDENITDENEIDFFVRKKLESKAISPAPKANKETLIRRLSFSLTGLPPSIEEIDFFLEDTAADAYDKLIDRLLLSPHYGEHMAATWMDVARYADSDGYLDDKHRDFSPWRDWVIDAFNSNMSYKNFVTHQLAGDLIPNADQSSKIATAFNRLHKKNSEAGIIFEEFRAEYVADRTITFGKAFLGMTMECARCHDHKYDPISQKNFYEISSFFISPSRICSAWLKIIACLSLRSAYTENESVKGSV